MKKLVAVLMVMIMLAGMIPFAAFAEGTSDIPKEETPAVEVKNQTGYGEPVAEELSDLPENGEDKEKNENNLNDKNPEEPDGNTPATDETPVEGTKEGNGEGSVPEGNTTEKNKDPEGTEATEGSGDKDTEEKPEDNQNPKEENKTEEEPKEPVPTWDVNVGYMVNGNWVDWQIIKVPQNTGLIPRPQGNLPLSGYKIIGWYFADTHAPVVFNDTDGASVITETTFKSIYALLEEDIVTYTVTLSYNKSDLMDEIIYNVPTGYVFVDDERLKTYENGTLEETAEDGTVTVYKFSGWDYNGAQILSDTILHAIWEVIETIEPEVDTESAEKTGLKEEAETTEETDLTEKIELSEETEGEAAETEIETTEESSEVTGEELSEEEKISYSIKEEETDKEWVIGSGESFSLASEADLDKFVALYIDGKLVSIENLILTEGSTIVTPDEEILNALGEGEHTFEIVSADGSAKGKFTVMSLGVSPDASPEDIMVTFNLNGHGEKPIDPVKPDDEGKVEKPETPKADGWTFIDWYTDQGCTDGNEFSFNTEIKESITIYARWSSVKEKYTIAISYGELNNKTDLNGHEYIQPDEREVLYEGTVVLPSLVSAPMPRYVQEWNEYTQRYELVQAEYPTVYLFEGWEVTHGEKDALKGNEYGPVHADALITAKWKKMNPIIYKVSPSKYATIVKGAIVSGIYSENGSVKTGTLANGDVFYVPENGQFSIYSGVGNGVYVGLYIQSIRYGIENYIGYTEWTDTQTGGSTSSYIVKIAQQSAAPTGDDFNPGLWVSLAFVSLAGALMTFRKRTGKKQNK